MRSRALCLIAGVAVIGYGAIEHIRPRATQRRDFPAVVEQPPPLYIVSTVRVPDGRQACFGDAVMDARSAVARLRVSTLGRPPQPLTLVIAGRGYRVTRAIPATYGDNTTLSVPVPTPARDLVVRVCIENTGQMPIGLFASNDRTKSPYVTIVGGRVQPANPEFAFYEARPRSIAQNAGVIADRIGTFRPWWVSPWLLWPLALIVVLAVPLAALWVTAAATAREP